MRARNEIIKETTKFLVSKLPIEEQTKIINFYLGNEPHDKSTLFNDVIEIEEEGKARKTAEENIALILKNQEIYHKLFDEVKDTLNSIKKVNYFLVSPYFFSKSSCLSFPRTNILRFFI